MVMFSENQPSSQLEALLLQTAAGDREAFASLYHRTSPSVYGLALTYVRSGPDAEDVTQDTFVKVWDNAPAYRPQGKPLAWILTIAKNLALMCLRSREKSTQLPPEDWASLAMDAPAVTPEDRQVLKAALSTQNDFGNRPEDTGGGRASDRDAPRSVRTQAPGNRRPAGAAPTHCPVQVPSGAEKAENQTGRRCRL